MKGAAAAKAQIKTIWEDPDHPYHLARHAKHDAAVAEMAGLYKAAHGTRLVKTSSGGWSARFRDGLVRVGGTAESRARWLVALAGRQYSHRTRLLRRSSEADTRRLRWEALAFVKMPSRDDERFYTVGPEELPSWEDITRAHGRLSSVLGDLRAGVHAEVEAPGKGALHHVLFSHDGEITRQTLISELAFLDGFMYRVVEALGSLRLEGHRLRFCARCRRPFVGKPRELFDHPTCARTARTAAWRANNRDKFRKQRKDAYRRRVAAKHGRAVDKVKIQQRKAATAVISRT